MENKRENYIYRNESNKWVRVDMSWDTSGEFRGDCLNCNKIFSTENGAKRHVEKIICDSFERATIKAKELFESKKVCGICYGNYEGMGNDAMPVIDGRCCDKCNNSVVLSARLKNLKNF